MRASRALLLVGLLLLSLLAIPLPTQAQTEYTLRQGPFQGIVGGRPTGSHFFSSSSLEIAYDMETLTGARMRDFSGYGRHGNISGSPSDVAGLFGRARQFVNNTANQAIGSGDYDFPQITVCAWIYPTEAQDSGDLEVLAEKEQAWILTWSHPSSTFHGVFSIHSLGGWRQGGGPYTGWDLNIWQLACGTHDGVTIRTYHNNTEVASAPHGADITQGGGVEVTWGNRRPTGYSDTFPGRIDEAMVFSEALSQENISWLYNHRNYTFRMEDSPEPDVVATGPTWFQGDGMTMGAAVNSSSTVFTVNVTDWDETASSGDGLIAWESFADGTVNVTYNFTLQADTAYNIRVDGALVDTLTTNADGNASFDWTSWTTHQFQVGETPAGEPPPAEEGPEEDEDGPFTRPGEPPLNLLTWILATPARFFLTLGALSLLLVLVLRTRRREDFLRRGQRELGR